MDKMIVNIFKSVGLGEEDIKELCNSSPEVCELSFSEVDKRFALLEDAGFPRYDLGSLVMANPTFLFSPLVLLAKKVKELGSNIEEKLKQNPNLI